MLDWANVLHGTTFQVYPANLKRERLNYGNCGGCQNYWHFKSRFSIRSVVQGGDADTFGLLMLRVFVPCIHYHFSVFFTFSLVVISNEGRPRYIAASVATVGCEWVSS